MTGALNGSLSNAWKFIASFLAGLILAGFPALFLTAKAPSQGDLRDIEVELAIASVARARLEERVAILNTSLAELRLQVLELTTGAKTRPGS